MCIFYLLALQICCCNVDIKGSIYIFNYELEYLQLSSQPTETQTWPRENSKKHFAMQDVVFSIQYLSRDSAFTIHQPNSPEKNLTENIHEENEFA